MKSTTIKVYFNEPIKAGSMSITLKTSTGKVIKTKNSINNKTITISPLTALSTGVKYYITFNTGSVKSLTGIDNSKYSSSFTVSPLTLAQMKDGISRAEKFYNTHQRLPKYINYGSKKIPIATFQKIIATQGLKIKTNTPTPIIDPNRPVYITSDNIVSKTKDNARINNIIKSLNTLGIKAYNMGVGPNNHIKVLQTSKVPKNALIVNIYGGACAGTIWEMGGS